MSNNRFLRYCFTVAITLFSSFGERNQFAEASRSTTPKYCGPIVVKNEELEKSHPLKLNMTTHVAPIHNLTLGEPRLAYTKLYGLEGRIVFEKNTNDEVSKKFVVTETLIRSPAAFHIETAPADSFTYPVQFDFGCTEVNTNSRAVFSIFLAADTCAEENEITDENTVLSAIADEDTTHINFVGPGPNTFYTGFVSNDYILRYQGPYLHESCSVTPVPNYLMGGVMVADSELEALVQMLQPDESPDEVIEVQHAFKDKSITRYVHADANTAILTHADSRHLPGAEFIPAILSAAAAQSSAQDIQDAIASAQALGEAGAKKLNGTEPLPTEDGEKKPFNWILFVIVPGSVVGGLILIYCCFFCRRRSRRP